MTRIVRHSRRVPVAVLSIWTCAVHAGCGGGTVSSTTAPTPSTTASPANPPPSLPIPPTPASCQMVSRSGVTVLSADVGTPGTTSSCVLINTSGATLDCQQHIVNGFVEIADGLRSVTVTNCAATGIPLAHGLVNLKVVNCTLRMPLSLREAHGALIQGDSISPMGSLGGAVILENGGDNQVLDNVLDGGYRRGTGIGADDGIILGNEDHDTIRGNTIRNVFDAGIEGLNAIANTTITANTISDAWYAGIGAYYCTAWRHNTIDGNLISQSAHGVYIVYDTGKCLDNPPDALFLENVISNNVLTASPGVVDHAMDIRMPAGAPVAGNLVAGNNFAAGVVNLSPLDGFQNGGGNSCLQGGTFTC